MENCVITHCICWKNFRFADNRSLTRAASIKSTRYHSCLCPKKLEGIEFDRLLGSGAFNNVYLSKTNQYVFKQPKIKSPLTPSVAIPSTDIPENAIVVWNSINGEKLGMARVVDKPYYGWLCPYVSGNTPTSKEVSDEIINIYADTKRILYDAHQLKNFVKRESDKKIFCIDLGLAIVPASIQVFNTDSSKKNFSPDEKSSATFLSSSKSSNTNLTQSIETTSVEKDIEKCLATHIARIKSSESVNYANEEPSITVLALAPHSEARSEDRAKAITPITAHACAPHAREQK